MTAEGQDEEWKTFLEGSMFEDHFDELEKICLEAYGGNSELFDNEFLRPMCWLLQELKTAAEKYFTTLGKAEKSWLPCYERFVTSVIHLSRLDITMHKGDFYFHLNFGSPGEIALKYYSSGEVLSRPLAKSEYEDLWVHNWTDRICHQLQERFLFMNCIVNSHTGRGLERRPWRYLMAFDTGSHKGRDGGGQNGQLSTRDSTMSVLNLLHDLDEHPMSALDVNFEVLHSKVIFMPGTRDSRGAPVIFVDAGLEDWQMPNFNAEEIARVCLYFYQIPRREISRLGLSILIDARRDGGKKSTLQIIGEALILFEEMRPGSIHVAYILGRKDSYLLMFSANKLKEQLKFQFQFLSSFDDLVNSIKLDQIPSHFGGSFVYNHDTWLQFRLKQEPFMAGCRSATKLALSAIEALGVGKCGETSEECQRLLEEHQKKVTAVFSDSRLSALQLEGEQLVANLKQSNLTEKTPDWKDTMEIVSKLYFKMNQVFSKLDVLCRKRKREIEDCLQMRCFHEEYAKVFAWIENDGSAYLENPVELAESYSHAISQHNSLEKFINLAKENIMQANDILEDGSSLIQSGCSEGIGIKEMCKMLKCTLDRFTQKLEGRRLALVSCIEFHQLVRQCSNWSINGLKHMALMNMEASNTGHGVASLRENMEGFLQEFPMWSEEKLGKMGELASKLNNEELHSQAEKCLSEYKEVEDMFIRRQETLQRAAVRVQIPGTVTNGVSEGSSSTSTSNSTSGVHEDDPEYDSDEDENEKMDLPVDVSISPRKTNESDEADGENLFYNLKEGSGELDEQTYQQLSPKTKEKLKYIVDEMVDTERDYVKSLEYIIQNYVKQMENEDLPASLKGRKNLVFGNLERLYDFHNRHFSQELERCVDRPFQIGDCFLKWERQFFLYALYNKNKPISDELLRDHGSVYFRKRQEQLNDRLDLCSYLIKPVQRIGKYALLLKDMIKAIEVDSSCTTQLLHAQEMVKSQLRHGNDLLAMDSIRECDVNVKEQGRLLQQNDFIVWQSKKKHCRRVFLFEDLVLFSKTRKQASGADIFVYKNCLKTADIGLTESVGDSGLRFELWFRRRRNVKDTVILQAKNMDIKTSWVIEITRLLWRQAVRNREYGLAEFTTGISVGSQPGEQVPTTRSHIFDESLHFSPTISMSVISTGSSFSSPYTSPLLNKRRFSRTRNNSLGMKRGIQDTSPQSQPTSTPIDTEQPTRPTGERLTGVNETIAEEPNTESPSITRKSKSYPAELSHVRDEFQFERRPSLKERLFGRTKSNENELRSYGTISESVDGLHSKDNNKSKRRSFKELFSTSPRPLSAIEVPTRDEKSPIHRTQSEASTFRNSLPRDTADRTPPQQPLLTENSRPSNACYHSVV